MEPSFFGTFAQKNDWRFSIWNSSLVTAEQTNVSTSESLRTIVRLTKPKETSPGWMVSQWNLPVSKCIEFLESLGELPSSWVAEALTEMKARRSGLETPQSRFLKDMPTSIETELPMPIYGHKLVRCFRSSNQEETFPNLAEPVALWTKQEGRAYKFEKGGSIYLKSNIMTPEFKDPEDRDKYSKCVSIAHETLEIKIGVPTQYVDTLAHLSHTGTNGAYSFMLFGKDDTRYERNGAFSFMGLNKHDQPLSLAEDVEACGIGGPSFRERAKKKYPNE